MLPFCLGFCGCCAHCRLAAQEQSAVSAESGSHTVFPGAMQCRGPSGQVADSLFFRDH